jgi:hypothetical protein
MPPPITTIKEKKLKIVDENVDITPMPQAYKRS